MRLRAIVGLVALLAAGVAAIGEAPSPAAAATPTPTPIEPCPDVPVGYAKCLTEVAWNDAGLGPSRVKRAYGFPLGKTVGVGQTVAVVTAFDAPTIENDLNVFSRHFGLPTCTTANGCFTKIYARGTVPSVDVGWALETSLDVEWVHAIAPGAKIIMVEASSNNFGDLFQAFDVAHNLAPYISNSWGGFEFASQTVFDPLLNRPGISEFFGSGDSGAGPFYPASSPEVIAVGGTRLTQSLADKRNIETGWSSSGGGCSVYFDANPVQAAFGEYAAVGCAGKRATPDLAAIADPQPGVAIYDSTDFGGLSGWRTVGGTSTATPIMAARAASTGLVWDAAYVYSADRQYRDILKGNNGFPTRPGFDLVTGRGRYKS